MKNKLFQLIYTTLIILMASCNQNEETIIFEGQEYWGKWHAGDTTSIQYDMKVVKKGKDTIYYTTHYYPNGIEKTKTLYVNDKLITISFVNDTNGNPYSFGRIVNGTGHVKQYDHQGTLIYSGNYQKGNREGWWYSYHFKGEVLDSSLYKDGFNISAKDSTWVNDLFGLFVDFSGIRDNLYN